MVEVNKELSDKALQLLNEVRVQGKLRKGTNEATKSIERGEAKLVAIASDVTPAEIIMHLPVLCDEKNIPYVYVQSKAELGAAAGLPVGTSAIAIANAGDAAKKLSDFVESLKGKAKAKAAAVSK
jgi:large subunit ribosomal protein L7Ae